MSRICFAVGGRIFKSKAAPVESPWMFGGIALNSMGVAERPRPLFARAGFSSRPTRGYRYVGSCNQSDRRLRARIRSTRMGVPPIERYPQAPPSFLNARHPQCLRGCQG
jgi:hypothetical protein